MDDLKLEANYKQRSLTVNYLGRSILLLTFLALPVSAVASLNDYFVSTDWLANNRDSVVIVDVRKGPFYLLGHIEGAHHVARDQFLDKRNGVKSLVPPAAGIKGLLGSLGASPETVIVVYADDKNPYSARFAWTLLYHGHANVKVLDGGYEKWSQEDRPTSLIPTKSPQQSHYVLKADADFPEARAEADYLFTRLENPGVVIWDTRRSSEFVGEEVRANRGGHIPGAVHFEWTNLLQEVDGVKVLKSREEIEELLLANGISADKEIVAHCQTGIRSSYATLVLLGLGYDRVKNYDGSWIEWANNPTLPIVNANGELEYAVSENETVRKKL
jgi:thiosulfate/3-mercaptopyruvate sulfurtransferase